MLKKIRLKLAKWLAPKGFVVSKVELMTWQDLLNEEIKVATEVEARSANALWREARAKEAQHGS